MASVGRKRRKQTSTTQGTSTMMEKMQGRETWSCVWFLVVSYSDDTWHRCQAHVKGFTCQNGINPQPSSEVSDRGGNRLPPTAKRLTWDQIPATGLRPLQHCPRQSSGWSCYHQLRCFYNLVFRKRRAGAWAAGVGGEWLFPPHFAPLPCPCLVSGSCPGQSDALFLLSPPL